MAKKMKNVAAENVAAENVAAENVAAENVQTVADDGVLSRMKTVGGLKLALESGVVAVLHNVRPAGHDRKPAIERVKATGHGRILLVESSKVASNVKAHWSTDSNQRTIAGAQWLVLDGHGFAENLASFDPFFPVQVDLHDSYIGSCNQWEEIQIRTSNVKSDTIALDAIIHYVSRRIQEGTVLGPKDVQFIPDDKSGNKRQRIWAAAVAINSLPDGSKIRFSAGKDFTFGDNEIVVPLSRINLDKGNYVFPSLSEQLIQGSPERPLDARDFAERLKENVPTRTAFGKVYLERLGLRLAPEYRAVLTALRAVKPYEDVKMAFDAIRPAPTANEPTPTNEPAPVDAVS